MARHYAIDDDEAPSEAVIAAMAAEADCSPLELEPLSRAIDPEVLDRIVRTGSDAQVTFTCCERVFTVTEREVRIEKPP